MEHNVVKQKEVLNDQFYLNIPMTKTNEAIKYHRKTKIWTRTKSTPSSILSSLIFMGQNTQVKNMSIKMTPTLNLTTILASFFFLDKMYPLNTTLRMSREIEIIRDLQSIIESHVSSCVSRTVLNFERMQSTVKDLKIYHNYC